MMRCPRCMKLVAGACLCAVVTLSIDQCGPPNSVELFVGPELHGGERAPGDSGPPKIINRVISTSTSTTSDGSSLAYRTPGRPPA